mgnify:CR=1 FL=1
MSALWEIGARDADGNVDIRITYDHRVLDGGHVAADCHSFTPIV